MRPRRPKKPPARVYQPRLTPALPLQRWCYTDLDGTLIIAGKMNINLLTRLRTMKDEGWILVLWSARGAEPCQQVVDEYGLMLLFDFVLSKPGALVDDKRWNWARYVPLLPILAAPEPPEEPTFESINPYEDDRVSG